MAHIRKVLLCLNVSLQTGSDLHDLVAVAGNSCSTNSAYFQHMHAVFSIVLSALCVRKKKMNLRNRGRESRR